MTASASILEDTQTKGGGSNAPSEEPSGDRAKRDKQRGGLINSRVSSVTEKDRRRDTDSGISGATPNPATQTVAPSAAPAHFTNEPEDILIDEADDERADGQWCFSTEAGCWIYE